MAASLRNRILGRAGLVLVAALFGLLATWADVTKARELLGWEPKVSWQEGVDRLLDWYAEHRDWTSKVITD